MLARPLLIDWAVGGPVVGFVLAVLVFCLANQFYHGIEDDLEVEDVSEPEIGPDKRSAGAGSLKAGTTGS